MRADIVQRIAGCFDVGRLQRDLLILTYIQNIFSCVWEQKNVSILDDRKVTAHSTFNVPRCGLGKLDYIPQVCERRETGIGIMLCAATLKGAEALN